jgi:bifunctional non-homologous end joining protein LigD
MVPMQAGGPSEPFDSESHIFELLWEGLRAIVCVEGRSVRIQDAFGRDVTDRFPEFDQLHQRVSRGGTALDGVIVALNEEGKPSFNGLLPRLLVGPLAIDIAATASHVAFQAFDILYQDGRPVMSYTLRRRKEMLLGAVRTSDRLAVPEFVETDGIELLEAARQHGLGGVIAKEIDGFYSPGRTSKSWLTIPAYNKRNFVVAGFTFGGPWRGKRAARHRGPIESVLLGLYDEDGGLHYVGEASGTFAAEDTNVTLLDSLTDPESPFYTPPKVEKLVFWCRPEQAASVRYSEWTDEGRLRFALFHTLRPDIPPETCRLGSLD